MKSIHSLAAEYAYSVCFFYLPLLTGLLGFGLNISNIQAQQINKLLSHDGRPFDQFGHAVSISEGRAIIGARHDGQKGRRAGSSYLVSLPSGLKPDALVAEEDEMSDVLWEPEFSTPTLPNQN